MTPKPLPLAIIVLSAAFASAATGDEPSPPPAEVHKAIGEVERIGAAPLSLHLRADDGRETILGLEGASECLKVPPGAKALSEATSIPCTDVAVGDRVFARGTSAAEGVAFVARQVIVMTKNELEQKRQAEREEWRQRGVGGIVTAVDPEKQEITIEMRSMAGARALVIAPAGDAATYHRYAPGSARFADARPCTLGDIRVGDQLRALGERSADGARFAAERVVAGAFRTLVGTVDVVDADARTVTLSEVVSARGNGSGDTQGRTFVFDASARLRRLPAETAARLAALAAGGRGERMAGRREAPTTDRPTGEGRRGPAERGAAGPRSLADMLDRFPALELGELTQGQVVAIAAAAEDEGDTSPSATRATALLAGIEPLLTAPGGARNGGGLQTGLAQGALDLGMGMVD